MPTRVVRVDVVTTARIPRRLVCRPGLLVPYHSGRDPCPSITPTTQREGPPHCSHHRPHQPPQLQFLKIPVHPKQILVTQPSPSASLLPVWTPLALNLPPTSVQARPAPPTLLHGSFQAPSGPTTTPASLALVQSV